MTYDVTGHSLLSEDAAVLAPGELEAQVDAAEDLLGLTGTAYAGREGRLAHYAVVQQVNHQLFNDAEAQVLLRRRRGDAQDYFREDVPIVSEAARSILAPFHAPMQAPEPTEPDRNAFRPVTTLR